LRDLVATTLENSGILGKIKAQLRANVYMALEEGENVKNKSKLVNQNLIDFLSTTNGRLVASLVREFLEFFDLDFTLAVFDPETNIGKDFKYRERGKLIDALGLTELTDKKSPLLSEIMRLSKVSVLKSESPTPSEVSEDDQHTSAQTSLNEDLSSKSDVLEKSNRAAAAAATKFDISEKTGDRSDRSEVSSHKSDKYSDDFSLPKEKNHTSDISDNSGSTTPEIMMKDSTLNLLGNNSSGKLGGLSSTFILEKEPESKKVSPPLDTESLKPKDSFLTDLPPLGLLGKSSLGDLPPLAMPGRGLAPLSKIPSKAPDFDAGSAGLSKSSNDVKEQTNLPTKQQENPFAAGRKKSGAPSFGFEPDHVISEKSESVRKDVKKPTDSSPDITENIEEELDSFLNSEISGGDDLTRDETIKEDASLRADYVESL